MRVQVSGSICKTAFYASKFYPQKIFEKHAFHSIEKKENQNDDSSSLEAKKIKTVHTATKLFNILIIEIIDEHEVTSIFIIRPV